MDIRHIISTLESTQYDFLRDHPDLGHHMILLGLGGSYAYGTNNDESDLDIRGIAVNSKRNLLLGMDFEQVTDNDTDTVIYSFDKIIKLLCNCNPNTIELLGLKPEHYFYLSPIGEALLENKTMFLSQAAAKAFGGYAYDQLRRLENKSSPDVSQTKQEEHILKSIQQASEDFKRRYFWDSDSELRFLIDKSARTDCDSEIFVDIHLTHYPLRDFTGMCSEIDSILRGYHKLGSRNKAAISHHKIAKHMMHLVRLFYMCFDILEKGEIHTYRDSEHELLMQIRNGAFLDEQNRPIAAFYELVNKLEKRLDYAKEHTNLPDTVDMERIHDFVISVNSKICSG